MVISVGDHRDARAHNLPSNYCYLFLKGGPTLCPFGPCLDLCPSRVDWWTRLGPVLAQL